MDKPVHWQRRGRGSLSRPDGRYLEHAREIVDDGWGEGVEREERVRTEVQKDTSRTVINYNRSPDVPFDRSINPYRGCEHGCVYCFARPTHAYLDLSPGLDFETRLFAKYDAATLLREELAKPSYQPAPVALGINTDAYQPVERRLRITRGILELLHACHHPVSIVTKSALVERDLDLLAPMAADNLCHVMVSVTTLDAGLSRRLEPRAAAPQRRLETIRALSEAGVPVGVLVAPLIPVLTDAELEAILGACREAGAATAGYVLLRLPLEVKPLFRQWLDEHAPGQAEHIFNRLRDSHGGREYRAEFGTRMRGTGVYADLLAQRFRLARQRNGYPGLAALEASRFVRPSANAAQMALF